MNHDYIALVHIHQGGTVNTYCGKPVRVGDVSWEQASKSNCPTCSGHFA
jgi:hypothetical protein